MIGRADQPRLGGMGALLGHMTFSSITSSLWLFRFLVRASRDLWAFLLGEGRFPRHSHLSPEDPSLFNSARSL